MLYYSNSNKSPQMRKIIFFLPVCFLAASFSMIVSPASEAVSEESAKMASEYRDKGLEMQRMGDTDTALTYYQKAVELDPTLAIAYNDMGTLYEAKGLNDRAKEAYGKAIDLDPNLPEPYYNLGSLYEKEGDMEKAIVYLKQRVVVGEWNDTWTVRARQELQSLGVSDPEVRADFMNDQMTEIESEAFKAGRPKGNDLDPKRRKREARMHYLKGKRLYLTGDYIGAIEELGFAETLDVENKQIKKLMNEVIHKAISTN